jgi:type I restriction enzyme S subunit
MGWPMHSIESLCEVFTDGDWIETKNQAPEGIRLIQTGNVGNGDFKNRRDKARFITEETFSTLKCCEIFEGDCLVSRLPDPVGRSCLLPETGDRMITAVDCTILRFKKDKLLPEFFNYYSQSSIYLNRVESLTSGATRKRISRKNLGIVEIPLPPIPEQKRIVAILDQAFADIDRARELTERNLHNARELFESYLQQVFSQRGEGWVEKPISDLGLVQTGNTPKTSDKDNFGDYIPFVKPGHFLDDGNIELSDLGLSEQGKSLSRVIPENSVLMVCIGATIGKCGHIAQEVTCNQQINALTPSGGINYRFAYYQMLTPRFQSSVIASSGQATLPIINKKKWSSLKLSFPDLKDQLEIVEALDKLKARTSELEGIYLAKNKALDELKKSLLEKAFTGELTRKEEAA